MYRRCRDTFQSVMLFGALCPTDGSPCLVATPEELHVYGMLNMILAGHRMFVGSQMSA